MDQVEIRKEEERFREVATEARRKSKIPEKGLADINDVDPSQVSRWFSYTGNQQFPAFRLAFNPKQIVLPILKYLAQRHEHVLVERTGVDGALDGEISDEVLGLAAKVGRLAEDVKDGKIDLKQAVDLFEQIINEASKGLAEVKKIMDGKVHKLDHGKA